MGSMMQGYTDVAESVEDDEMGDISVANHYHYGSPPAAPAPAAIEAPAKPSGKRYSKTEVENYIKRKIEEGLSKQPPPAPAPAPLQPTAIVPTVQDPWWKRYVMPAIVGTAVGGTGLGAAALINRPSPSVDTDTQYKFQISSGKGTGFSTDAEVKLPAPKQQ